MLTPAEKTVCEYVEGLFCTVAAKYCPQHSIIISSLQYHKMQRKQNESIEEWIGSLRHEATECEYDSQHDRQLKEQFIQGINDDTVKTEYSHELTSAAEGAHNCYGVFLG